MAISSARSAATPSPTGLTLVAVRDFTAEASVSLDGVFTSAFDSYRIMVDVVGTSGGGDLLMRLRAAGADNSAAEYTYSFFQNRNDNITQTNGSVSGTSFWIAPLDATNCASSAFIDVFSPALNAATKCQVSGSGRVSTFHWASRGGGSTTVATQYDGLTLYPTTGTMTGTVYVYGYSKTITQSGAMVLAESGLIKIASQSFAAVSSVAMSQVFSGSYRNYKIMFECSGTVDAAQLQFRLRAGSTDATAAVYSQRGSYSNAAIAVYNLSSATYLEIGHGHTTVQQSTVMDVLSPARQARTRMSWQALSYTGGSLQSNHTFGYHDTATAYDGFSVSPASGTITGLLTVYGYKD